MEEKPVLAPEEEARRQFLARCGRFAIVTPPTMALLVSVAATPNDARASTIPGTGDGGGGRPKHSWWSLWELLNRWL